MPNTLSMWKAIVLAAGALPLVSAGCPYNAGNEALKPRSLQKPGSLLEKRFHEGAELGRCSRKNKYAGGGTRSWQWWPCELSLAVLRQNGIESNPLGAGFDYSTEFPKINCESQ
jgi:catalase-peroxidase